MTASQPATPGSDSVREVWHGPDGREVMTGVHLAALRAAGWTVLPPAETQQDDERDRLAAAFYEADGGDRWEDCWLPSRWLKLADIALAARPSADTETLRRVRELADEWRSEGRHGADAIALYAAVDGPR